MLVKDYHYMNTSSNKITIDCKQDIVDALYMAEFGQTGNRQIGELYTDNHATNAFYSPITRLLVSLSTGSLSQSYYSTIYSALYLAE